MERTHGSEAYGRDRVAEAVVASPASERRAPDQCEDENDRECEQCQEYRPRPRVWQAREHARASRNRGRCRRKRPARARLHRRSRSCPRWNTRNSAVRRQCRSRDTARSSPGAADSAAHHSRRRGRARMRSRAPPRGRARCFPPGDRTLVSALRPIGEDASPAEREVAAASSPRSLRRGSADRGGTQARCLS